MHSARRLITDFPGRLHSPRWAPPAPAHPGTALSLPGTSFPPRNRGSVPGRAPHRAATGDALPLAEPSLSSIFIFFGNSFPLFPSCRKRREAGGGGGREKYCSNSQRGASGAPCAWHLCSLCPEQHARTGARGRRASVGCHNKVTKQRNGAATLSKGEGGGGGRELRAAAPRYYAPGKVGLGQQLLRL